MGHGNDMHSILVMSENNLKWGFVHAARLVPSVNPNETFGIGLNARQCDVDGNAKVASRGRTALGIPIRGCFQLPTPPSLRDEN
jgi:hypothetical protein